MIFLSNSLVPRCGDAAQRTKFHVPTECLFGEIFFAVASLMELGLENRALAKKAAEVNYLEKAVKISFLCYTF